MKKPRFTNQAQTELIWTLFDDVNSWRRFAYAKIDQGVCLELPGSIKNFENHETWLKAASRMQRRAFSWFSMSLKYRPNNNNLKSGDWLYFQPTNNHCNQPCCGCPFHRPCTPCHSLELPSLHSRHLPLPCKPFQIRDPRTTILGATSWLCCGFSMVLRMSEGSKIT